MTDSAARLLGPNDPPAFEIFQPEADSPFLVTCDHASLRFPTALGDLGVPEAERATHIAWDIGAAGFAKKLAVLLGAPAFLQGYSRLVIDCNRPLIAADSIPVKSGGVDIPGNQALDDAARQARVNEIFRPYHGAIEAELLRRKLENRPTILVLAHSFTPNLLGSQRPWHTGVLYNRERRLVAPLLELLRQEPGLVVGDNEPYFVADDSDYAANVYGERTGTPYAELEIRQDLLADDAGQEQWAERYARLLRLAAAAL